MSKHEFNPACQILARYCPKTWQIISGRRYLVPDYRQRDYGNQRAAGKDYKFEGTSGESHRVAFKGGGAK